MDANAPDVHTNEAVSSLEPAQRAAPAGKFGASVLRHLPRLLAVLLAAGLAIAIIVDWNEWVGASGPQWTDDASLQADLTPLSAQVAGRNLPRAGG